MESPLQIINRRDEFDYDGFKRCIDDAANGVDNPPYTVTAVIGSQQTGKSSLLNQMFGTTFATRSGPIANRTTDGIWTSIKTFNGKYTLIFDIEGMDSLEMKDRSMSFEYKAGLFALFVADIVMFNIFYEDISGSAASGFDVYEKVASVYADVNGCSYKKKTLLFLIRDWNAKTTKEEVEEAVKNKFINPIIYYNRGNDTSESRDLSSYFDYKIVIFPSYYDDFSNFKIEANKLKNYLIGFNSDHSLRALFTDLVKNFSRFWVRISEMDELDIPNLKERISAQECDSCSKRLLMDAHKLLDEEYEKVNSLSIVDITRFSEWEENFMDRIEKFKKSKLEKFDELMEPFDVKIVKTKREYLNEQFTRRFNYAFELADLKKQELVAEEMRRENERKFNAEIAKIDESLKQCKEDQERLAEEREQSHKEHVMSMKNLENEIGSLTEEAKKEALVVANRVKAAAQAEYEAREQQLKDAEKELNMVKAAVKERRRREEARRKLEEEKRKHDEEVSKRERELEYIRWKQDQSNSSSGGGCVIL